MDADTSPMDDRRRALVRSVDDSDVVSVDRLKPERTDLLISCASGQKHLLRFEETCVSLLRQKWGYERLSAGGVPCPKIEAFLGPDDDHPSGWLLLSWVDAVPAGEVIRREGPGLKSYALCRRLGQALRVLNSIKVTATVPEYVYCHTREGAHAWSRECSAGLRTENLIDGPFEERANQLVDKYVHLIPDPFPRTLCFSDMHFSNVLVHDGKERSVAAFVDVEEIGVGWPMGDFANWEC